MAKKLIIPAFLLALTLLSCSKDEEEKITNRINHVGEKWRISSVTYTIVDQSLSGMNFKNGTKSDAGAFYFNGGNGSFDILVEGYHEEDFFSYTETTTSINITSITQSVGSSNVSQSVIAISGDKPSTTTMTVDGTITRQAGTGQIGQFVMTGTFTLVKD